VVADVSMARENRSGRSSRISVNLTPNELAEFQAVAVAEGRSMSNLCHQLIQAFLAQRQRSS
jgi:hypothetical protein